MSRDTDIPPGLRQAPNRKHTFHFNSLYFYSFNLLFAPKFVQKTISLMLYVCICLDGKDLYMFVPHCYFVINFTEVFVHGSLALSSWPWIIRKMPTRCRWRAGRGKCVTLSTSSLQSSQILTDEPLFLANMVIDGGVDNAIINRHSPMEDCLQNTIRDFSWDFRSPHNSSCHAPKIIVVDVMSLAPKITEVQEFIDRNKVSLVL